MTTKPRLLPVWLLILLLASADALATPSPTEQLKTTIDPILGVLEDPALDAERKREKIRGIIGERFDFRAMSQRTLAQNWKSATKAQQERFVQAFRRLLEDTYLAVVEEYSGEKIQYVGEKIRKEKYAQVDTLIVRSGAPNIPVDYKSYLKGERWLVYDVVIEGVSMISNYRTSYQQIAKTEGIDGLIAKLEQKTDCPKCT
jgi:phospholipid transport system substrate-binding protein